MITHINRFPVFLYDSLKVSVTESLQKVNDIVMKIYEVASRIFKMAHIIGKVIRRRVERPNISYKKEPGESPFYYLRRIFYDRVEISPAVGLDPRINKEFFKLATRQEEAIPEPPQENILDLVTLFNKHVPTNSALISDDDTPATYAELQAGIESFMKDILAPKEPKSALALKYPHSDLLHTLLKHLCAALKKDDLSPKTKEYWLVELARAGKRSCPTRMTAACRTGYAALVVGEIEPENLLDRVVKVYHDLREQIIKEMSRGDVHTEGELLLAIGKDLKIQNAELGYNDDPFLMDDLAPQRSFPMFFKICTAQRIIDCFKKAINGSAIGERREGKKIPTDLIWDWMVENIPKDFHPEMPKEERKLSFVESTEYAEKGVLKEKGIVYLLTNLSTPILNC